MNTTAEMANPVLVLAGRAMKCDLPNRQFFTRDTAGGPAVIVAEVASLLAAVNARTAQHRLVAICIVRQRFGHALLLLLLFARRGST